MSYPLRLPEHLDLAARERATAIGISFNAFICVAVDAYLRGPQPARIEPPRPAAAPAPAPAGDRGPYAVPGVTRPVGEEYKDFYPEEDWVFFDGSIVDGDLSDIEDPKPEFGPKPTKRERQLLAAWHRRNPGSKH